MNLSRKNKKHELIRLVFFEIAFNRLPKRSMSVPYQYKKTEWQVCNDTFNTWYMGSRQPNGTPYGQFPNIFANIFHEIEIVPSI